VADAVAVAVLEGCDDLDEEVARCHLLVGWRGSVGRCVGGWVVGWVGLGGWRGSG